MQAIPEPMKFGFMVGLLLVTAEKDDTEEDDNPEEADHDDECNHQARDVDLWHIREANWD
jgi:hypothetical protein